LVGLFAFYAGVAPSAIRFFIVRIITRYINATPHENEEPPTAIKIVMSIFFSSGFERGLG